MNPIPAVPWPHNLPAYPQNPPPLPVVPGNIPPVPNETERLRLELAANRATLAEYASALAEAQAELREWKSDGLMTAPGHEQMGLTLDRRAPVVVEFRRTPAVSANFDDPGEPEQVEITSAYVNKTWIDASEFAGHVLDGWIAAIKGDA